MSTQYILFLGIEFAHVGSLWTLNAHGWGLWGIGWHVCLGRPDGGSL
jgi:hypothetical protein